MAISAENIQRMEKVAKLFDNLDPMIRDKAKNILLDKGFEIYTLLIKELPADWQSEVKKIMGVPENAEIKNPIQKDPDPKK